MCMLEKHTHSEDLAKLQQWEADWQMQFNASKCETIRITRKRSPIKTDYSWTDTGHSP